MPAEEEKQEAPRPRVSVNMSTAKRMYGSILDLAMQQALNHADEEEEKKE